MNNWLKRVPHLGWLTVFAISLVACMILYHWEKQQYSPRRLVHSAQKDFVLRENAVIRDHQTGTFGRFLSSKNQGVLSGSYFLFLSTRKETLLWNTSQVDLPRGIRNAPDSFLHGRLQRLTAGYFYVRTWPVTHVTHPADSNAVFAYTLIPVVYNYPLENQYFQSRFVADLRIPVTTGVSDTVGTGSYAVFRSSGAPAFYLSFREKAEDIYTPGLAVWLLTIVTLLSFSFWLHEVCLDIGPRSGKPLRGWLVLSLIMALVYFGRLWVAYPAGYLNSELCSPELFSSGEQVRSLGDFILVTLITFWLLVYFIAYVPVATQPLLRHRLADRLLRLALAALLILFLYHIIAVDMRKLVIDSKISFQVGDFSSLTLYTFIGIFTLSVITINFLITLGIINALLEGIIRRRWLKYVIIVAVSLLVVYRLSGTELNVFNMAILVMSLAGLLLIDSFGMPMQRRVRQYDLSIAPTSYLWFAILCSWITVEIFYFNYMKEKELRIVFAQKQQQMDNDYIKYTFSDFATIFEKDTVVQSFFRHPSAQKYGFTDKYLFYNYLSEYARKYKIGLYYYDKQRKPLWSKDSADTRLMHLADSVAGPRSVYGSRNTERETDNAHMFWLFCPVPSSENPEDTLGYVGFDVSVDKTPRMMSRRSFLGKKYNPTDQLYFDKYAYGIYRNNTLWTQLGSHVFPYVSPNGADTAEIRFFEAWNSSRLVYRSSKEEQIEVIYDRNLLISIVSLFSYVLAVLLLITGVTFFVRQLFFYPARTRFFLRNFNFTIRTKINLTILVTVFASLLVVGIITLSFLSNKYKENQRRSLQNLLLYYAQNISQFLEERHLDLNTSAMELVDNYSDLSYQLNALAEAQGADINLYNGAGKLVATSQPELVKNGLLSRHIQPEVFRALRNGDQTELLTSEHIGDLTYQSIYTPLRNRNDKILAYVNLPYYASQNELNDEISNVLVSLINVYALIFFLSGIFAIVISNSIIKSFRLLIDQFRNIRLRHNEYIEWPYKDEIGVLVKEYNTMMQKVEVMASRLARTEREAAWREIARQVAHEIKNPLTPMKLNIQYLQQAIKNNRPDINALASRVSDTLIEQIENLNLIASEFSSFAKMPEADPELLNVDQALHSLVHLFQKDSRTAVVLEGGDRSLWIYMDKSYFIRIFTNLIQNAIQAIEEDKEGLVEIRYEQKDHEVVVAVIDNGSGFPEELQEKLFLPYFTTKSSGTGLGLSMTRNMVEHSNGRIWFETAQGEGSTFYVQLPLATEAHNRAAKDN